MTKSILISRPDHDPITKYLFKWSEEVIAFARSKGIQVYKLDGKKSRRPEFESYVQTHRPTFLFFNGHGDANTITGYDNKPLVDTETNLEGSIVYARSCDAGRVLGLCLVKSGTKAFIGYKRKFICGYLPEKITRPLEDTIARLFLEPSNLVASTLIKNHTAEEAHNRSIDAMYRNFRRMISSAATYEERYAARWLWGNINSQVLLGDPRGKI